MAVMPHTDVERALEAALSLDIPFWPQLLNTSCFEDMYVQASEHFPGIHLCGNPDWDFLLGLDLDVLSLDVYTNAQIFSSYG